MHSLKILPATSVLSVSLACDGHNMVIQESLNRFLFWGAVNRAYCSMNSPLTLLSQLPGERLSHPEILANQVRLKTTFSRKYRLDRLFLLDVPTGEFQQKHCQRDVCECK